MTEQAVAVVQSNKLVEARYALTVGEQRLILAMVSKIKISDEDFTEYRISLAELSKILDMPLSYVYREIERITNLLMSRVLTIRDENGGWLKIHWICKARYANQSVSLSFMPDLKPYLIRLQNQFTICDLNIIRKFKSIYTIRIYQLLKQYQNIKEREFNLAEFRKIVGIDNNNYIEFCDFRKRVINQALKEMEAKDSECDLSFKLETIKEGRKITRIKFIIQQRKRAGENKKSAQVKQAPPVQLASAPAPPAARINRFPFEHDVAFGEWLAMKGLAVDLLQWAESGKNSVICRVSYNDFLREREKGGS